MDLGIKKEPVTFVTGPTSTYEKHALLKGHNKYNLEMDFVNRCSPIVTDIVRFWEKGQKKEPVTFVTGPTSTYEKHALLKGQYKYTDGNV